MAKIVGFDKRLREAMNARDIQQKDLERMTGISKSSLSHYMNGVHSPTTDKIYLLANALKVNEAWLLGYDVPMDYNEDVPLVSPPNAEGLSEDFLELYRMYLRADKQTREMVKRMLELSTGIRG